MKKLALLPGTLLLLSACFYEDDDKEPAIPATPGYSAYIQANLSSSEDTATIGASIYKDGRKITLVAGDAIEASNGTSQKLLKGHINHFGFYTVTLPIDDVALPIDFIIKHEPVETREDRWYPADIAYVDPGPGPFVGLSWSMILPLPVNITAPTDVPSPVVYNYADDNVIIEWASDSNDIDNVRINALLECLNQTVEIYDGADTGQTSVTIADIFSQAYYNPVTEIEEFTEDIFHLILDPFDVDSYSDLITDHFITHCDIQLYVLAEYNDLIGPPFVAGNIVASQSDSVKIVFNPFSPLEL